MPEAINVIGEKGGGKTLFLVWWATVLLAEYPKVPVIENVGIDLPNCKFQSDILRTIAALIVANNKKPVTLVVDEGAMAGLESRDSWGGLAILRSREIALTRKITADLWIITQMMSMIDKRGQWLSDYDMLCEAHYESPTSYQIHIPDWFEYTVYNPNRVKTAEYVLYGSMAAEKLFNLYDTTAVPNRAQMEVDFTQGYRLDKEDILSVCELMNYDSETKKKALDRFELVQSALAPKEKPLAEYLARWGEDLQYEATQEDEIVRTIEGVWLGASFHKLSDDLVEKYNFERPVKQGKIWEWKRAIED